MKKLPIGIDNFEELISGNYYFVDKSLLIKDILDAGAKATLIPRPRRFGKTLSMSMLQYFFEKTPTTKTYLFHGLNITQYQEHMAHQGQYPVISLSFKDAKVANWHSCYEKITRIIAAEFSRHRSLLDTNILSASQRKDFLAILDYSASPATYECALKDLSAYLTMYHNKKPIILIDEYDAPIQAGFMQHYYKDVINFMRGLLCGGLKDNPHLSFAIMTGILRVAKESIFSGLNNLKICSILNNAYSDKFGLLEHEVTALLEHFGYTDRAQQVTKWYNGYASGDSYTVYNPWSILNFADNDGKFQPYWLNTSDNAIIKELIEKSSTDLKIEIEQLLSGQAIEKYINENIIFDAVFSQSDAVWSFLLFSGYLSFDKIYLKEELLFGSLLLPNAEVKSFYKTVILEWLKNRIGMHNYLQMLKALVEGSVQEFKDIFYEFVLHSFSAFDTSGDEPERFYHAFVLGMLVSLSEHYEVKSNKESGYGRYDVMVIPKDSRKLGIIIEFKKVSATKTKTLEHAVHEALQQIEDRQYATELNARGITNILKLGIAFDGKRALVQEKV